MGVIVTKQTTGTGTGSASGGSYSLAEKLNMELEMEFKAVYICYYKELTYNSKKQLVNVGIWVNQGKYVKLFNKDLSYNSQKQLTETELTRISDGIRLVINYYYNSQKQLTSIVRNGGGTACSSSSSSSSLSSSLSSSSSSESSSSSSVSSSSVSSSSSSSTDPNIVTWDKDTMGPSGTTSLSENDYVFTNSLSTGTAGVWATHNKSTGKYYFEVEAKTLAGSKQTNVGISYYIDPTYAVPGFSNAFGAIISFHDGRLRVNGGSILTDIGQLSQGNVVGFAVDLDNLELYVSIDNVWGSKSGENSDPETRTDPIWDIPSGHSWYPYAGYYYNADSVSGAFKTSKLVYPPPSGYVEWEGSYSSSSSSLSSSESSSSSSESITPLTLWSTGLNTAGQLGIGNISNKSSPTQVGSLTDWAEISTGYDSVFAIKNNGTLWSWGNNANGQLGHNDYPVKRSSPTQVGSLTDWDTVHSGQSYVMYIKTDGTLWGCGGNAQGQLGDGTSGLTTRKSSPVQIGSLTDWSKIVCGQDFTFGIKTDDTLWSWGDNTLGQLGQGNITLLSSPTQVGSLTDWDHIASGENHAVAIKTDGTIWAWGFNNFGQLGLGDQINRSSPVQVGLLTDWDKVTCGYAHVLALKTDGTVWAWGAGTYGKLGQGNTAFHSSPVQVGNLTTWDDVGCSRNTSHSIDVSGALWSWGDNSSGVLGINTSGYRNTPTQVGSLTTWVKCPRGYAGRDFTNFIGSH